LEETGHGGISFIVHLQQTGIVTSYGPSHVFMATWCIIANGIYTSAAGVYTRALFLGPFIALITLSLAPHGASRSSTFDRLLNLSAFSPYVYTLESTAWNNTSRRIINRWSIGIQRTLRFTQHYRLHVEYTSRQFFLLLST